MVPEAAVAGGQGKGLRHLLRHLLLR